MVHFFGRRFYWLGAILGYWAAKFALGFKQHYQPNHPRYNGES